MKPQRCDICKLTAGHNQETRPCFKGCGQNLCVSQLCATMTLWEEIPGVSKKAELGKDRYCRDQAGCAQRRSTRTPMN